MGRATIRGGYDTDTWVRKPTQINWGRVTLNVNGSGADASEAFLYLRTPVPRGSTVKSATLRLWAKGASSGSRTVTVMRIASSWKAGKLNWNNRPGIIQGSARTVNISTVTDGQLLEFDVAGHLQTVADGSAHYGWRITTNATTTHKFYSKDADKLQPQLVVEWADAPGAPTGLVPSSGVVSLSKPVLRFDYADLSGDEIDAVRVQIDPTQNGTTPAWTTDTAYPNGYPTLVPELDLAGTTYPGLASGATTSWRVKVQDATGLWSGWSDWATFTRRVKGTLTITNPPAPPNNYVTEPTPPIIWSFSGTQSSYRVRILRASDRAILWDSGRRQGSANSIDVPFQRRHELWSTIEWWTRVLVDDENYIASVLVWDEYDRETSPGDPSYVMAERQFFMDDDLTVAPPTLTVAQDGITPWVVLTWNRSTAPDEWVVFRDGRRVAVLDAGDVSAGGTSYRWADGTAEPHATHSYQVQAVVNRKAGERSNTVTVMLDPEGIWLLDLSNEDSAVIFGNDAGTWTMTDQAASYTPVGGNRTIRVVTGMRGLEGNITGQLVDTWGYTAKGVESVLLGFKERPTRPYQLVAGDISIPVILGDLTVFPTPSTSGQDILKGVSFDYWQAGDLGFKPVL